MIDTVTLITPWITEKTAEIIESISEIKIGIDNETKEQLYYFTTKRLKGSFDYRIRLSVKREKWVSIRTPGQDKATAQLVKCKPYVEIECSLHKFHLGHNIYGGSDDLIFQVKNLIQYIEYELKCKILKDQKDFWDIQIKRIDYAKVYKVPSTEYFFKGFSNVYYPRRQPKKQQYGDTGLYFASRYTTLKLYDKHAEYKKNDYKRIKYYHGEQEADRLLDFSKNILRVELEIKAQKLKHLYDHLPTIKEINIDDLDKQFQTELNRIFKMNIDSEGSEDMKNYIKYYNNSKDVQNRLISLYGTRLANTLLGTWYRLSVDGYESVKAHMNERTFYRHINQLKVANCTWNHTDIIQNDSNVIQWCFNPIGSEYEIKDDLINIAI